MEYTVIRSSTHYEYAYVEANSREEAIRITQSLDEEAWEVDGNAELTEQWIYEAGELE